LVIAVGTDLPPWIGIGPDNKLCYYSEENAMRITVDQQLPFQVNPLTARGRAAVIDGEVTFTSSDETIATVEITGPTSGKIIPTGKPGLVQITARFDADLDEGVREVVSTAAVEIVEAEATSGVIEFGEPEEPLPEPTPEEPTPPTEEPTPPTVPPVEVDPIDQPVVMVNVPEGTVMPVRAYGKTVVNVKDYGATGDGTSNDTAAFKAAVQALPEDGGTVRIPKGVFALDASITSWLRSNLRLYADPEAYLKTIANDDPRAYLLLLQDMHDVVLQNIRIIGDRLTHTYTVFPQVKQADGTYRANANDTHEWGHGLAVRGACLGINLINCDFRECTGDGASLAGRDIFIYALWSQYNRRQGLTIGGATDVKVYNCDLLDTGDWGENLGTNPKAGIDIEPDRPRDARRIHIYRTRVLRNRVGFELYCSPTAVEGDIVEITDIDIEECEMAFNSLGSACTRTNGVRYRRCNVHDNRNHGIKLIGATTNTTLDDMTFHNNFTQNGPQKPRDFKLAGTDTRTARDINISAEATNTLFPTESTFN